MLIFLLVLISRFINRNCTVSCILRMSATVKCFFFALQSNVIEAGPNMQRESEKEWYYGNADKERLGPYGFDEVRIFMRLT